MWSFLLGSAVGYIALNTGPLLRKGLAWAIVKSESGLQTVGKEARRIGARMAEDVEDIFAEATAQREAERSRQVGQVRNADRNWTVANDFGFNLKREVECDDSSAAKNQME